MSDQTGKVDGRLDVGRGRCAALAENVAVLGDAAVAVDSAELDAKGAGKGSFHRAGVRTGMVRSIAPPRAEGFGRSAADCGSQECGECCRDPRR